jgi:hypothetical protein
MTRHRSRTFDRWHFNMYMRRLTNALHESEDDWEPVKPGMKKDGTLEKLPLEKQYVKSAKRIAHKRAAASGQTALRRRDASIARCQAAKASAASDAILASYSLPKARCIKHNINEPEPVKVIKVKVPRIKLHRHPVAGEEAASSSDVTALLSSSDSLPAIGAVESEVRPAVSFAPTRVEPLQVAEALASAALQSNDRPPSPVTSGYVESVVQNLANDLAQSTPSFNNVSVLINILIISILCYTYQTCFWLYFIKLKQR